MYLGAMAGSVAGRRAGAHQPNYVGREGHDASESKLA